LRVFRLLRLLRALRMITYFEGLWNMVRDLLRSTSAMLSTIALITITLYIAACFAVELVAKDKLLRSLTDTRLIIDEYFTSIDVVMITFLQFATVDSLASIYWPLVKHRRYLLLFFGMLIVVVSIALMNLVTANLVSSAISNGKRDKELEKQKFRRLRTELQKTFCMMDKDNDHTLTRAEVAQCHIGLPPAFLKIVPPDKFVELFDILDSDDSGKIDEEEFIEGIEQIVMSNVSFKSMHHLRTLAQIRSRQDQCITVCKGIHNRVKHISRHTSPLEICQPGLDWQIDTSDSDSVVGDVGDLIKYDAV